VIEILISKADKIKANILMKVYSSPPQRNRNYKLNDKKISKS